MSKSAIVRSKYTLHTWDMYHMLSAQRFCNTASKDEINMLVVAVQNLGYAEVLSENT
ncbi:hypothetical protein HBA_0366 [Sodalis endosymbiont of Henestaris halophilus]|nr:hypothetical protein HBA_0366 [Sodalis endosymbiont of Henestaris halophilus]